MAIEYRNFGHDKENDNRVCLGISTPSGYNYITAYAYMVNPDYTVHAETVYVVDYDYEDCSRDLDYRAAVVVDATPEIIQKVRAKNIADLIADGRGLSISECAWRGIKAGDVIEVVKGRKYKAGTLITVANTYTYRDCYDRFVADYAVGTDGEKVNIANCTIKTIGNGSLPEAQVGDRVIVTKDIINPSTNEVRYTKGTVVEVARFEVTEYGKRREYVIGTKGERLFKPFTRLFV